MCGLNCFPIVETLIYGIYSQIFKSKDELYQWVGDAGNKLVILIAKSNSGGRSMRGRVWFSCERGGKARFKKLTDADGFRGVRSVNVISNCKMNN